MSRWPTGCCSLAAATPEGKRVQLDIPAPIAAAQVLVATYGMAPVFQTARMYTGEAPRLPLERLFGVTSFELG